jgi:hypothetical protein
MEHIKKSHGKSIIEIDGDNVEVLHLVNASNSGVEFSICWTRRASEA